MPDCSFCDDELAKGTGVMFVKRDGTIYHFCSSKCRKNTLKLGREGRRQKWTRAYRVFKGKEKKIQAKKETKEVKKQAKLPEEKAKAKEKPKKEVKKEEPKTKEKPKDEKKG